jgi:hypothetical protein
VAEIANNYNAYVSSGIMTNTNTAKAFSTLAPFENGTRDYAALKSQATTSSGVGATNHEAASTNSQVMCLSCHRSHATAFESITRFYLGNEFMTVADAPVPRSTTRQRPRTRSTRRTTRRSRQCVQRPRSYFVRTVCA